MTDLLQVFLLSMAPVGELRLAIPLGLLVYHLNVVLVFFVAVFGNLVPVVLILLFLKKITGYLSEKFKFFKKVFKWWENNTRGKYYKNIQKYGIFGLALFVAVPLPLTGAWTGALLATLMNLSFKKSFFAISIGVVGAGLIVSTLVVLGINIEKYLGWQVLVSAVLVIGLIYFYFKKNKKRKIH